MHSAFNGRGRICAEHDLPAFRRPRPRSPARCASKATRRCGRRCSRRRRPPIRRPSGALARAYVGFGLQQRELYRLILMEDPKLLDPLYYDRLIDDQDGPATRAFLAQLQVFADLGAARPEREAEVFLATLHSIVGPQADHRPLHRTQPGPGGGGAGSAGLICSRLARPLPQGGRNRRGLRLRRRQARRRRFRATAARTGCPAPPSAQHRSLTGCSVPVQPSSAAPINWPGTYRHGHPEMMMGHRGSQTLADSGSMPE